MGRMFGATLLCVLVTSSFAVRGQVPFDEAMQRLKAKTAAKHKPAETQPQDQPAIADAVEKLKQVEDSLNSLLAKDAGDSAGMEACYSDLVGKTLKITGTTLGVTTVVPAGTPTNRAILLRIDLPPAEAADASWRTLLAKINHNHDERIRLARSRNRKPEDLAQEIKQIENERTSAIADIRGDRPPVPVLEMYLSSSETVLDSVSHGQTIRGSMTPRFFLVEKGGAEVAYASRLTVVADYAPQGAVGDLVGKASTDTVVPKGKRIIFVVQCSGGMLNEFTSVRDEMNHLLDGLSDADSFNVVISQEKTPRLFTPSPANANLKQVRSAKMFLLDSVTPHGESNLPASITIAERETPTEIWLLSNGDILNKDRAAFESIVSRYKVPVNVIAFGENATSKSDAAMFLAKVADLTNGKLLSDKDPLPAINRKLAEK